MALIRRNTNRTRTAQQNQDGRTRERERRKCVQQSTADRYWRLLFIDTRKDIKILLSGALLPSTEHFDVICSLHEHTCIKKMNPFSHVVCSQILRWQNRTMYRSTLMVTQESRRQLNRLTTQQAFPKSAIFTLIVSSSSSRSLLHSSGIAESKFLRSKFTLNN